MSFFRQLFAPSLLRALVSRTVGVAVVALIVLAAVALYESNDLVTKQFEDEANIVADRRERDRGPADAAHPCGEPHRRSADDPRTHRSARHAGPAGVPHPSEVTSWRESHERCRPHRRL